MYQHFGLSIALLLYSSSAVAENFYVSGSIGVARIDDTVDSRPVRSYLTPKIVTVKKKRIIACQQDTLSTYLFSHQARFDSPLSANSIRS